MAQPSETPILPRSGTKSLPKGGVWGGVGLANDAAGGENAIRQRDMMHHGHRVSLSVNIRNHVIQRAADGDQVGDLRPPGDGLQA